MLNSCNWSSKLVLVRRRKAKQASRRASAGFGEREQLSAPRRANVSKPLQNETRAEQDVVEQRAYVTASDLDPAATRVRFRSGAPDDTWRRQVRTKRAATCALASSCVQQSCDVFAEHRSTGSHRGVPHRAHVEGCSKERLMQHQGTETISGCRSADASLTCGGHETWRLRCHNAVSGASSTDSVLCVPHISGLSMQPQPCWYSRFAKSPVRAAASLSAAAAGLPGPTASRSCAHLLHRRPRRRQLLLRSVPQACARRTSTAARSKQQQQDSVQGDANSSSPAVPPPRRAGGLCIDITRHQHVLAAHCAPQRAGHLSSSSIPSKLRCRPRPAAAP